MRRSGSAMLAVALVAAGLLAAAVALAARDVGMFGWAERPSVDARYSLRGDLGPPPGVLLVALDTRSYRGLPRPPVPRRLDAELVERLTAAGARVIAFDLSFEDTSPSRSEDVLLRNALEHTRAAVVSVTGVGVDGSTAPLAGRFGYGRVVRPGVTLFHADPGGVIRAFPPNLGPVANFSLIAARDAGAGAGVGRPPAGALIDYPGPPGTVRSISLIDALEGRFDPSLVANRVVVIGSTAPVLHDSHPTPVGAAMPGAEIHADAIATALAGYPLRRSSAFTVSMLLVLLSFLVPLVALVFSSARRFVPARVSGLFDPIDPSAVVVVGVGAVVGACWTGAVQLAFDSGSVWDYTDGLFAVLVSTTLTWGVLSVRARRARRRLRRAFAEAQPDALVTVLDTASDGGSVREAEQIIDGFRLEGRVGSGGMGVIYEAEELKLGRTVALKLIRQEFADATRYQARFRSEGKTAAQLNHPHIVPIFDTGEDQELLYISMQLIDGTDVARLLDGGSLEVAEAVRIVCQIASALDLAHKEKIVHRDVKPANIILRGSRPTHAYLTDFGVARRLVDELGLAEPGGWVGTPDYLAPELARGAAFDHRVDVYALTGVLFHCVTGGVPFPEGDAEAKVRAHETAARPSLAVLRPDLPAALDGVILRGMAREPNARYDSAGALAADACRAIRVEPDGDGGQDPKPPTDAGGGSEGPTVS